MIYRHGLKNRAHFAHQSVCTYPYYEPETEEHLKGKRLIKKWLESLFPNNVTLMEYYVKDARQRADVMTIFPDGHRLCVEFQCSVITEETWRKRYAEYKKANISQVWLIGSTLLKTDRQKFTRIRLNHFSQALNHEQKNKLFIMSVEKETLIFLTNLLSLKSYKTIFRCTHVWEEPLLQTKMSKRGIIDTKEVDKFLLRKRRSQEKRNMQLVESMKPWTDPSVYTYHEQQYRKNLTNHPVYQQLIPYYNLAQERVSVLFDQYIEDDQIFKIDHRLWQSFLFFTEIYQIYRRNSKYDSGLVTPTLFVKSIIHKTSRTPNRPFSQMIEPYLNRTLMKAKRIDPITFDSILCVHEIIYEYLDRLACLGFLRNVSPRKEMISSGGKLFGRFEVVFDRFYPELFHTAEDVQMFFQNHNLHYKWKTWYDVNTGKQFR